MLIRIKLIAAIRILAGADTDIAELVQRVLKGVQFK